MPNCSSIRIPEGKIAKQTNCICSPAAREGGTSICNNFTCRFLRPLNWRIRFGNKNSSSKPPSPTTSTVVVLPLPRIPMKCHYLLCKTETNNSTRTDTATTTTRVLMDLFWREIRGEETPWLLSRKEKDQAHLKIYENFHFPAASSWIFRRARISSAW